MARFLAAGRAHRRCSACLAALLLILAGCSGPTQKKPAAPAPVPAAPQPPVEPQDSASRIDRLCRSLGRIVAAEIRGFADLRGEVAGDRAWIGREVPPSMHACTVEGAYHPGAEYVCRGEQSWRGRPDMLEAGFAALTADLDACLGRTSWGQHRWTRGQTFEFAAGERQILWRYGGNVQRPGLSLKIEEDIGSSIWFIRLAALTLR